MRRTFFRRLMVVATVCFFSLAINGFAAEDNSPLATDSSWQDDNQRGITAYHKKNIPRLNTITSKRCKPPPITPRC